MSMETEQIRQAIRERIPEVYEVFASMDDEYVKLVREYHQIASMTDRYTTEFIAQKMQETKKAIKELMQDRLNAAKEVIARIREDFSEEPQEPTGATGGVERQLERNNNLILWNAQLPVATVDELREMYQKHKNDPDFMVLLNVELRKRKDDPSAQKLKYDIENPTEGVFAELDKLEKSLTFALTTDMYPARLATRGINNIMFRSISEDLKKHPVQDGATYRPVFDLPAS